MSESHGMKHSKEYNSWRGMRERCNYSKHKYYNNYGGRGISVCERWNKSFINFYKDMGPRPEGSSIDRINTDGNYEPSNCRWATRQEQTLNSKKHKNASSYSKGVVWMSDRKKWHARIHRDGIQKHLGQFDNELDAHIAYKAADFLYKIIISL